MDRVRVAGVARMAGLRIPDDVDLEVVGEDPVIPTPLLLGEAAAAIHVLIGAAASALWKLRTGRRQAVRVDLTHAAGSLMSPRFLSIDGRTAHEAPATPPAFKRGPTPSSAMFQAGDGRWVHLQSEFAHLVSGLLELLDCEDTPEGIAAGVGRFGAQALEDALAARGLCGVMARTPGEWAAHPQGRAIAGLPVVEIERIGDAPAEELPPGDRPLAGVRVFDATRVLAGPTCARTLAAHGADVLHIAGPSVPTMQVTEIDTGHGKRQALLDLKSTEGAALGRELVAEADVLSQSYRPGKMEQLGLGPSEVAAIRPGVVYVSVNAWGHRGPWRDRPGWEQLAQTATGVAAVNGSADEPAAILMGMNDYGTGLFAAYGVMEALRRRATEGGSWHVKVALARTSMWYLSLGTIEDFEAATGLESASRFVEQQDSPFGRMERLPPVVQLSETPPRWDVPTRPLGSDRAQWLPRAVGR